MIGFGQLTMIPDANFEQALINLSYDTGTPNGSVPTANIDTVTSLVVDFLNISDLTGIEDFISLTYLECQENLLTSLDLSGNTSLTYLVCSDNQITSLDVNQNTLLTDLEGWSNQLTVLDISANTLLTFLSCGNNLITSLDVSQNTALTTLSCLDNQLTSLDVSTNTSLTFLDCGLNQITSLDITQNTVLNVLSAWTNQLTSIDLRNGNNTSLQMIHLTGNLDLTCINVEDVSFSLINWTGGNYTFNSQHYFSNNCLSLSIKEHTTNKELLRVTDLLGRETKPQTNTPLIEIYDDGTVEKIIVIE